VESKNRFERSRIASYMNTEKRYWFRAKRYGLGWGLPCSWQGWAFFLSWLAVLTVMAIGLMPRRPFLFALALGAMTLILVMVCYIKGEPLSGGSGKPG
jgi:hypothetical protein